MSIALSPETAEYIRTSRDVVAKVQLPAINTFIATVDVTAIDGLVEEIATVAPKANTVKNSWLTVLFDDNGNRGFLHPTAQAAGSDFISLTSEAVNEAA